jgi:hypothetical protein
MFGIPERIIWEFVPCVESIMRNFTYMYYESRRRNVTYYIPCLECPAYNLTNNAPCLESSRRNVK